MPSGTGALGPKPGREGDRRGRCLGGWLIAGILALGPSVGVCPAAAGLAEVERDLQQGRYEQALAELKTLAIAGDGAAQRRLGDLLAHGLAFHDRVVMTRDPCAAAGWYGRAAGQGDRSAMLRLGLLYLEGRGVRRNLVQAYGLVATAAARGEREAVALREALARQMTRRQLARGERLVRERPAGP